MGVAAADDDTPGAPLRTFVGVFFVTVATILGTGILGLPVELRRCGFWPFFLLFVVSLCAQGLLIILIIELLQYAVASRRAAPLPDAGDDEHKLIGHSGTGSGRDGSESDIRQGDEPRPAVVEMNPLLSDSDAAIPVVGRGVSRDADDSVLVAEPQSGEAVAAVAAGDSPRSGARDEQPGPSASGGRKAGLNEAVDLHTMGRLFLGRKMNAAFNAFVLFHFLTILSSYGIAGAQAVGQLLGLPRLALTAPYVLLLTTLVIFGQALLNSVVSSLTLVKGLLLVAVVAITGALAGVADHSFHNDWGRLSDPFLITTVALGGAINTLPVYFQRISFSARDITKFRAAALLGLAFVWILNVLWSLFLLRIVPQDGPAPSLEAASESGEIATVPLTDIIKREYPSWVWVGWAVQVFIALSVTVSFFALGSGLKHTLDGLSTHLAELPRVRRSGWYTPQRGVAVRYAIYSVGFGIVLTITLADSRSFFEILDTYTSAALNLESTAIVLMCIAARSRGVEVPKPLREHPRLVSAAVSMYFMAAVAYDLVEVVIRWSGRHA